MQAAWVGESVVPATEDDVRAEGIEWASFPPEEPTAVADQLGEARGINERNDVRRTGANPKDEAAIAKEADEHTHLADEVRLLVEGEVVYDIRSADGMRWLRLWLYPGDAIVVPARRYHRVLAPSRAGLR